MIKIKKSIWLACIFGFPFFFCRRAPHREVVFFKPCSHAAKFKAHEQDAKWHHQAVKLETLPPWVVCTVEVRVFPHLLFPTSKLLVGWRSLLKMLMRTFASLKRRVWPHLKLESFFVILMGLLMWRVLLASRFYGCWKPMVLLPKFLRICTTWLRKLLPSESILSKKGKTRVLT